MRAKWIRYARNTILGWSSIIGDRRYLPLSDEEKPLQALNIKKGMEQQQYKKKNKGPLALAGKTNYYFHGGGEIRL